MADSDKTKDGGEGGTRKPSWPISQRAADMERNTNRRGQGWSKARTAELNDKK